MKLSSSRWAPKANDKSQTLYTPEDDEYYDDLVNDDSDPDITMSGLFGGGATTAASNASATQGDLSKDVQVSNPPEDGISDLAFSPASEHLAVASWDKKVRIYEIDGQGNSQGKALFDHEAPVLSCCWSKVRTAGQF